MSDFAGKIQYKKQDCEIVYVEEKAPEPWIQRESFYNKDLPPPEEEDDDDERLYGAKHIGSFMVPSPLMRLKTPSSMSSFNSDFREDGRISPVPSLDISIKSERRDSDSSLARSKKGQSYVESLPQFHGLFDDSKVCIKDNISLDNCSQIIESSPLGLNNEELSENTSEKEQYYLNLGAVCIVDEKLGLASIMESENLTTKQTISNEGLKNLTHQTNDPTKRLHSKSTGQKTETEQFSSDAVKEGKGDFLKQSTNKGARQVDLSSTSDNFLKSSSMNVGNLAKESLSVGPMETCIGVNGSYAVAPLAALGAAGVLLSELTDHVNSPASSEIKNLESDQRNEFVSMEDNLVNDFGNSTADERKFSSGIESLDRTQRKDFIFNEDNAFNSLGYSSVGEGKLPTEKSYLDEVSESGILPLNIAAISSKIGVKSSGIIEEQEIMDLKLSDQDEAKISGRIANGFELDVFPLQNIQDPNKLSDNLASYGYVPSPNLNESLQVPFHAINDQNMQNLVNPAVDIRFGKDKISLNDNMSDSLEAANMKKFSSENAKILNETTIPSRVPETDGRLGKENESSDSKANLFDVPFLSNLGVGLAVASVIGTSAEIVVGSEFTVTPGTEILGLNESAVKIYSHRPESTTETMNLLSEPIRYSDIGHLARGYLGDSKQSDLADINNLTEYNSSVQLEISTSSIIGDNGDKFTSTAIEGAQVQVINMENGNDIHDKQIATIHQGSEGVQLESENIDDQLFPVNLRSSADKLGSDILKNEGSEQDGLLIPSTELESDVDKLFIGKVGNDFMRTKIHNSAINNDQNSNIESEHFSKQLKEKELNSILLAYDSLLNSEMNEVAEHLAANDIKSDDYAKAWFESIFSGPEFCPTLSEEASSIFADYGPVGLAEIALHLIKSGSNELLELDSRNEILMKLTSDMNPDDTYLAKLGSYRISPELLSSLQDIYANEFERNNESEYDSKLTLLVAKCRNSEELLKQLSKIIKEMNDDIHELTRESNKKSLRIKTLEDALQKK